MPSKCFGDDWHQPCRFSKPLKGRPNAGQVTLTVPTSRLFLIPFSIFSNLSRRNEL